MIGLPVVGIYVGPGGESWFDAWLPLWRAGLYRLRLLSDTDVRGGRFEDCDALLFPGGDELFIARQLGDKGRDRVRGYVQKGGGYVGVCAGAIMACGQAYEGFPETSAFFGLIQSAIANPPPYLWNTGTMTMVPAEDYQDFRISSGSAAPGGAVPCMLIGGPLFQPSGGDKVIFRLGKFEGEAGPPGDQEFEHYIGLGVVVEAKFGVGRAIVFSGHPELLPQSRPLLLRALDLVIQRAGRLGQSPPAPGEGPTDATGRIGALWAEIDALDDLCSKLELLVTKHEWGGLSWYSLPDFSLVGGLRSALTLCRELPSRGGTKQQKEGCQRAGGRERLASLLERALSLLQGAAEKLSAIEALRSKLTSDNFSGGARALGSKNLDQLRLMTLQTCRESNELVCGVLVEISEALESVGQGERGCGLPWQRESE